MDIPKADDDSAVFALPGHESIQTYVSQLFKSVVATSKTTNVLPPGNDFHYYASFSGFQEAMNLEGDRLLHLMTRIMKHQGAPNCRLSRQKTANDLEEKTESLVDANDLILERVNNLLDEASGKKKTDASNLVVASLKDDLSRLPPPASRVASWNRVAAGLKTDKTPARSDDVRLLAAKNVVRPQLSFKDVIDNGPSPFVNKLRVKPHAKTPIHASFPSSDVDGDDGGIHPYRDEIRTLVYPPYQLEAHPEPLVFPEPLEATPYTFVNTVGGLVTLVKELSAVDSFAVDLEAHTFRTFQGLTCLMQISTSARDFIVDVLVPEVRQELQMLNEAFANPDVVKYFHGADWDVVWLQRDFGIYIVNMFDTYRASQALDLSRHSLAFLLQHYCDVETNKKYQLADWRIRPLPEELVKYARSDTHYLSYIAAKMKNELLAASTGATGGKKRNLLAAVLQQSAQVTLKRFVKPIFDPEGYRPILLKHKKSFNSQQMAALFSLYGWRDASARREDESVGFVLPNHMMISIAEVLPREPNGILACCNPLPPLVKQFLNEIHRVVMDAKDVALVKPFDSFNSAPTKSSVQKTYALDAKYNSEKLLQCPLDTSHAENVEQSRQRRENNDPDVTMDVDAPELTSSLLENSVEEAVEKVTSTLKIGRSEDREGTAHRGVESAFSGGTNTSSMVSSTASAAAKAAIIHASLLSPFRIFLPPLLAPVPPGVAAPPKWEIKMIKKNSKIMEIQKKAAEKRTLDATLAEEEATKAKKAKDEKTEKKNVLSLSAVKEREEEEKEGKKKVRTKKRRKKMVNLNKDAADGGIDVAEIQEAKAKIFRESKKQVRVLGKNEDGGDIDVDETTPTTADEGETSGGGGEGKPKKGKKKAQITPFDYSKSDASKVLSKGLNKKQAEEAQVDPRSILLKKKKGLKKALGKQHYGGKASTAPGPGGGGKKRGGGGGAGAGTGGIRG